MNVLNRIVHLVGLIYEITDFVIMIIRPSEENLW